MSPSFLAKVRGDLKSAVIEDCPDADITSEGSVRRDAMSKGIVVAKEGMTLAGIDIFCEVMRIIDRNTEITRHFNDGQKVSAGKKIISISGRSRSILKGERVALNYMQRMCGIATVTSRFVHEVRGTKAKILDTRKTTPNMRTLEKYAVRCGGGVNHRFSLSDVPLIKENHIAAAGGIMNAVRGIKRKNRTKVILEVTNKREVIEGMEAGAEILLLDNMSPAQVKDMVRIIGRKALVEVSGGVNLKNVRSYARAGVDRISVGAITHSAPSADLSLLFI